MGSARSPPQCFVSNPLSYGDVGLLKVPMPGGYAERKADEVGMCFSSPGSPTQATWPLAIT